MKHLLRLFLLLLMGGGIAKIAPAAEPPATLSLADSTTVEGHSRTRELLFPVTLSRPQAFDVSASFKTRDISTQGQSDYLPQSAGQIVIKAGATRANILIRVTSDTTEEKDESFLVQLGAPKRCGISDSDAIGFIKDDDYSGQISVGDVSIVEGNSGQRIAKSLVSFSKSPLHDISINYETKDDSAKASLGDYIPARGTLLFKPGRLVLTAPVAVAGDANIESDEKCLVRISAPGYNIARSLGVVTIQNDDYAPTPTPSPTVAPNPPVEVSIGDILITEGNDNDNPPSALFTVTLAQPAAFPLDILCLSMSQTAREGEDFVAPNRILRIETGQSSATFLAPIIGNLEEENHESFFIGLSGANVELTGRVIGACTILDDDYAGQISVADASVIEGNGNRNARFKLSLSPTPLHTIEVGYATEDGTATQSNDYAFTAGTAHFSPSQTEIFVDVPVVSDSIEERDENFQLQLSGVIAGGGSIGKGTANCAVLDDDYAGQISISDVSTSEGNSFLYSEHVVLTVSLTPPCLHAISFTGQTRDGSAVASGDYSSASRAFTVPAGASQGTVSVQITPDEVVESDETFSVVLRAVGPYAIAKDTGVVTILNDDAPPTALSGKIVFASTRDGNQEIYTINADGSNLTRLTNNGDAGSGDNFDSAPFWSPDGSKIIFESDRGQNFGLYVMNADGSNPTRLNDMLLLAESFPCWSADGSKIVFDNASFTPPNRFSSDIYSMNADGSNILRLTTDTSPGRNPFWSPDGSKIVFESDRDGNKEIYVMNADGSNTTRLTNNFDSDSDPAWSPDGSHIVFTSNRAGNSEIYRMNANGSNPRRLTNQSGSDTTPSWSPDGSRIVFTSQRDGNAEIYFMDANGSNPTRLTNNPGTDFFPSWASGSVASAGKAASAPKPPSGGSS